MQRKQEFICKTLDEGMELAVSYFRLSEEKIFINILEENEDSYKVEALVDLLFYWGLNAPPPIYYNLLSYGLGMCTCSVMSDVTHGL